MNVWAGFYPVPQRTHALFSPGRESPAVQPAAPPLPAASFLQLLEAMDPVEERPGQAAGAVAKITGKAFGAKKKPRNAA